MRGVSRLCGVDVKRPPAELVEYMRRARADGRPFWDAWADGVLLVTRGRLDGEEYMHALSATRGAWERAYEGQAATAADHAAAILADAALGDVQEIPDRPCDVCGADLDALGRSADARYCGADCQKLAAVERQREARAAYSRQRRAQVKATVAGGVRAA